MKKAIITVIGEDKIGIIHNVSGVLAACGVNILDISQTVLQEYFVMIMLVDVTEPCVPFNEVRRQLEQVGEKLGMSVRIQHEDIFNAMHRI
jgi:ACT domain-containing protein